MHRDTATALWYRRVDRRCFTAEGTTDSAEFGCGSARATSPASTNQASVRPEPASGWRPLLNDLRGWSTEAAADRL